mmetsp:Transcript_23453/g.49057  ORF Transcript_23453/g.49057 Transcript_23453/m.49057 type:complete len:818 (-) Transcript_23453:42-2495(-)
MSFRKIEEKALGGEPCGWLIAWCPTMDLVAFVTSENHIAVHRLSWAKLVTFTDAVSAITALAWSPDGGAIAAGHEDGHITIFDVEVGEAVVSIPAHSSPVSCITWSKWPVYFENRHDCFSGSRCSRFLAELLCTSENSRSSKTLERSRSVLLSGDSGGMIAVRISGTFLIGNLQICIASDSGKPECVNMKHVAISSDLSLMSVLIETTGIFLSAHQLQAQRLEIEVCSELSSSGAGYLLALDSSIMTHNADQLLQISSHAWMLDCISASLQVSVDGMCKNWKEAWDHMTSKLQVFEQQLRSHDSNSTVQGELLLCISSGCAPPALQAFLTSLREQGIRRWEKVMDAGCTHIQQQINQRVIPSAQTLVFRAAELLGLARWEEEYSATGLSEKEVEAIASEGEKLIYKASEIQALVQSFHTGMTQFCRWLERLTLRLLNDTASAHISSQDALVVATFIKTHLSCNRIAFLLDETRACALTFTPDFEDGRLSLQLLSALDSCCPKLSPISLSSQLKLVKEASDMAVAKTKVAVASKIQIGTAVHAYSLSNAAGRNGGVHSSLSSFEEGYGLNHTSKTSGVYLALSNWCGKQILVLRLSRQTARSDGRQGDEYKVSHVGLQLDEAETDLDLKGASSTLVDPDMEASREVVDLCWYGHGKIAAISCRKPAVPCSQSTAGCIQEKSGHDSCLMVAALQDVDWIACPVLTLSGTKHGISQFSALDIEKDASTQHQVLAGVERSWLVGGAVPVRVAVDASRQLGCVVLRDPWRVALFDMAEGEEPADHAEEAEDSGAVDGGVQRAWAEEGTDATRDEESGRMDET